MRIITGSARGCRLKTPKGQDVTRPTADRIKESLFNILGAEVRDSRVLDMFAGTGNLGLEALSRGAAHAVFMDKVSTDLVRDNAEHTRLLDKSEILRGDAFALLHRFPADSFDLIFCDPPYHLGLWEKALQHFDGSGQLSPNGLLVVEHGMDENDIPSLQQLQLVRNKSYGHTTQLSFFAWEK